MLSHKKKASKMGVQKGLSMTKRKDQLGGYAMKRTANEDDQLLELTGTYQGSITKHEFSLLGGYSYQKVVSSSSYMDSYDFPTSAYSYNRT